MKKQTSKTDVKEHSVPPVKKHGSARQGDSSRTRKGDPFEKSRGKTTGRK